MISVKSDFAKRKNDLQSYINFLRNNFLPSDVEKMIKSSLYLVTYNIIEGIISQIIMEFNRNIIESGVKYKNLNKELRATYRKYYFSERVDFSSDEFDLIISEIIESNSYNIKSSSLIKKLKLFSGNLNHDRITIAFKAYGFKKIKNNNSSDLSKVVIIRNRLAHGEVSYSDCCRNETVSEVVDCVLNVVCYLDNLIESAEYYIKNKNFLLN